MENNSNTLKIAGYAVGCAVGYAMRLYSYNTTTIIIAIIIKKNNQILKLKDFKENQLEIYFNGERGISEFVINCFAKTGNRWNKVGKYTTDFLIIKRNQKDKIHKALIIETKGSAYADDINFIKRKNFVETDFLKHNEEKYGNKKIEFHYLEDSSKMLDNIAEVNRRINQFFKD